MKTLARTLSLLLHPLVIPTEVTLLLLYGPTFYALWPPSIKIYLLWIIALFTMVVPAVFVLFLRTSGRLPDLWLSGRRERLLPLFIGMIFALLCILVVRKLPDAVLLRRLLAAIAACEAFCLAVTVRWKISLHLTSMGGVTALLMVMAMAELGRLAVPLYAAVTLSGLLASARLYLGCHNGMQILAGYAAGFAITLLALLVRF